MTFRSSLLAFVALHLSVVPASAGDVSVPPVPDCAAFEARGPMREVRITGDQRDDVPVYDVTLRFPVADTARYGSPPSARVLDAVLLNLPFATAKDTRLAVIFHDRRSIDEVVPIHIGVMTNTEALDVPSYLARHTMPGPNGLAEVVGTRGAWRVDRLFVNGRMNSWHDMIICDRIGTVPFPGCNQYFDYRNIDVEVDYRSDAPTDWRAVRRFLEAYLACAYKKDERVN